MLGSLMIPRADIVYLDVDQPLDESIRLAVESQHSRFPLCRGGLHQVLGLVDTKMLLNLKVRGGVNDLETAAQPGVFVPETLTGMELLDHFRASGTQLVFVVDEYGEVQGIVTLHDVLEAVTGEFATESGEDSWAVQREDGSWLLDGLIPIPELKDLLGLRTVPEEDRDRFNTLSGMLMWLLGRVPATGDVAQWEQWRLEVVDLDGKRVDKVLATRLPEASPPAEGDGSPGSPEQQATGA